MDAPLQGDSGGHTGTAPTNLHHIFPRIPHKQNNHLHTLHPNATNRPHAIRPNETVGAAPVCPPERLHSGVSIPTNTRIVCGGLNDGCALVGRRGRAHRHRPYQSPPNHAVCHYPIGVILSIAQGWQVQRSLPWVTMQARRLPPWGLYFFHHIAF